MAGKPRLAAAYTSIYCGDCACRALHRPPAQAPARELLNSERIAAAFGSYGVEVLEQDDTVRVSNLYSGEGEERALPHVRGRPLCTPRSTRP